jgi:hypothetical protein
MVLKRVVVVGSLLAVIAAAAFGARRFWQVDICLDHGGSWHEGSCQLPSPPPLDPNLAEIAGNWVEVRTGKHLLLWPDGHYGPRNVISGAGWRLLRPGHIELLFCFSKREFKFHFEGQELVVENGDDAGRYGRMSALLSALARLGVDFD